MMTIWTIGHSTRDFEEFHALLAENKVELLVDVRRFPHSKRLPQFNQPLLAAALREHGIEYLHEVDLGGRRSARKDSPHTGWRVEAFRGYADYMDTAQFQQALARLIEIGREKRTVIMCAEAVPWRCHRRLIADALLARDWAVLDIVGAGKTTPHTLTEFAIVREDRSLAYPAPQGELNV